MCFEYDGYPEIANQRVSTARKPHKCAACRGPIASGEKYHYYSGKYDGHFFSDKVCRRCEYDIFRVVEHELAEGCHWDEAWPAYGDLVGYLQDSGMGQTRPDDVPATFQIGDLPKYPREIVAATGEPRP